MMEKECLACRGTNKISSRSLYLMAYKNDIKRDDKIPKGARNLARHILELLILVMGNVVGSLELSYRRGIQEGEDKNA